MLIYFETCYIGKLKIGSNTIRKVPCYPIKQWNCRERTLVDMQKTNNSVESWHKQFENDVGKKHPSVYKLIEEFRKEQSLMERKLEQIRISGDVQKQEKKQEKKDASLKKIVLSYDKMDIPLFFDRMYEHLKDK